jgi:hypothetical protein
MDINLRNELLKCYIWSIAVHGAENWMLWKVDRKYLESFDMCCWRRKEKIRLTDHVRYKVVLQSLGGQEYPIYNKKK